MIIIARVIDIFISLDKPNKKRKEKERNRTLNIEHIKYNEGERRVTLKFFLTAAFRLESIFRSEIV